MNVLISDHEAGTTAAIDDLSRWIGERLDADAQIDDEVGLLVLAALEGDAELDQFLHDGTTPASADRQFPAASTAPVAGAFLRSLRVTGFRGIGGPVDLPLSPCPGLTVVAGRNGSGKSSLAEGLELLLTGATYRWKNKKSTQWSEQWRNVHYAGTPEIAAEIIEEGAGPLRLCMRWNADGTSLDDRTSTAQRTVNGVKGPVEDAAGLGWTAPMETYRPMLSYDEVGGLLESGRSALYDALTKILGTEQLAGALGRIKSHHTRLSVPLKKATEERKSLLNDASELKDDERATAVAAQLRKTTSNTAIVRDLATGVTLPDQGVITALRTLTRLQSPDPAVVSAAAQILRNAISAMVDVGEAEAVRRVSRLDLRRRALELHAEHGEQSCPVCDDGRLDDAWASASRELVAREESELGELSIAKSELDRARRALYGLVTARPAVTDRAATETVAEALAAVRNAWDAWASVPTNDLEAADHLELHAEELATAVGAARAAASADLSERDDAWGPLAARIASWCNEWDALGPKRPTVDQLKTAETWLKKNDTQLKNQRIAPIADAAKHAWSLLRQESNVDLGELRLEGQSTRRRVEITASIDGVNAGEALPVMSQGELHALTLALFLPRATLDKSPFRFVILDDPIQAMDPAKVDGLVTLLSEIATTRQVVIFSHDDRLPAALRRTNTTARILEVIRGADSRVIVKVADDPTTRYLHDARSLCKDTKVPADTLRRTLPGLLRMAIESAARDRVYSKRISTGTSLTDVETVWEQNHSTRDRVSLALYDDIRSLDGWLKTEARKKGLGIATSGFHHGLFSGTTPIDAVAYVEKMIKDIQLGAK